MNKVPENSLAGLPDDHDVAARARAIFRAACEGTDSYHALRLGQARHKALEAGTRPAWITRWIAPLAGGAVACCALAVGLVALRPATPAGTNTAIAASSSGPLAAPQASGVAGDPDDTPDVTSNQTDMVQNLDFYRWLAEQPTVASVSRAGGN